MTLEKSYDAIVIGSGMGGLAAAVVLARIKQYRVLVLEQHFKLGGFSHTFQRPGGYNWDIGLHYVGEMALGTTMRKAMDFITGGKVDWVKMKDPFEIFLYPGFKFEVYSDRKIYLQNLINHFPDEAGSLRQYFRDMSITVKGLSSQWLPVSYRSRHKRFFQRANELSALTLKTYLDTHFKSERLKGLLVSQWGDYGLPPKLASFNIHATIAFHYLKGGYYPIGSSSTLASAAGPIIRGAGGDLRVRNCVKRILVEEKRTIGVEVENSSGCENIYAPEIYSDAGAETTYRELLASEKGISAEIQELQRTPTYGAVVLYLGLKSRCEHLGIYGQNYWIFDDFDHDAIWERRNRLAEGKATSCYLSFPGIKDPKAKMPTAEIMAPLDFKIFEKWSKAKWRKRGFEYEALKKIISETLLNFVEIRIPGFRKEVAYAELSTPLSVRNFTGHREGGIYGFPGILTRYNMKSLGPKTEVKGLSLVGVDAFSPGIAGAMMGGILGVAAQHGFGVFYRIFKEN